MEIVSIVIVFPNLDLILVPLSVLSCVLYHCWLWYVHKTRPNKTTISISSHSQRVWVASMLKDNDKKNILAIQTLRNYIMASTLVATTSVLICCAILSFDSRTAISNKTRISSLPLAVGGPGELDVAYKFATLLLAFLAVFGCQAISIGFINQAGVLVNIVTDEPVSGVSITPDRVSRLLKRGLLMSTVGNRLFVATLPLTLWIFGPMLVFVSSIGMIPMMYKLDIIGDDDDDDDDEDTDRPTVVRINHSDHDDDDDEDTDRPTVVRMNDSDHFLRSMITL